MPRLPAAYQLPTLPSCALMSHVWQFKKGFRTIQVKSGKAYIRKASRAEAQWGGEELADGLQQNCFSAAALPGCAGRTPC